MVANLFDPNFYRAFNPDLASLSDEEARQHFLGFGLNEGRLFSPIVDLDFYRERNPDLAVAGLTSNRQLYDHLSLLGVSEGRSFSSVFDLNFYRSIHPDLIAADLNNEQLFEHFSRFGIDERRASSPEFDVLAYLNLNPDLVAAGFGPSQAIGHYQLLGKQEGRSAVSRIAIATDPGNSIANAFDLGPLLGSSDLREQLTKVDITDFYRFRLDDTSQVSFAFERTSGFGSLTLVRDENNNGAIDTGETLETLDFVRPLSFDPVRTLEGILSAGEYFIRMSLDFVFLEQLEQSFDINYNLRFTAIPTAEEVPIDGAGQTIATARDAGLLAGSNLVFDDSLGLNDPIDIYRFTVAETTNISAAVLGLNPAAETTIELVRDDNSNGEIDREEIRQSGPIVADGGMSVSVPAGTYFVKLGSNGRDTPYSLTLSPTSSSLFPPDTAGNLLSEARDLGTLGGDIMLGEFVEGTIDEVDFYRFTLNETAEIGLTTTSTSVSSVLPVTLIRDFNGNSQFDDVVKETLSINNNGSLRFLLPAGEYFLQYPNNRISRGGVPIRYDFLLTNSPTTLPPDGAGNLLGAARDLGQLTASQTLSDFIDRYVDPVDLYRFVLDADTNVSAIVDLIDSRGTPKLRLFRDLNGDGILDSNPQALESIQSPFGSQPRSEFNFQVAAGTYFLEVSSSRHSTNGNYNLTIAPNSAGLPPDGAGNVLDMARDVDILTGESLVDFVGESDPSDVYRFTLDSAGVVDLTIAEQTEGVALFLLGDFNDNAIPDPGEQLAFDPGSAGEMVQIQQILAPGTYFAAIESTSLLGSNYSLDLSVLPI